MEFSEITYMSISVDGKEKFKLIQDGQAIKHLNKMIGEAQEAEVEPIIITDSGDESEAWWEDDSAFVFDIIALDLMDGKTMKDWPDGLYDFSEKALYSESAKERNEFKFNGHVLVVEPKNDDLSSLGKLCA